MMRNSIAFAEDALRNNLFKFKGKLLKIYLNLHGCKVGSYLRCHTFPRFRISPKGNIIIGSRVTIGDNITFEILRSGLLKIGDSVKLTQDILISSGLSVEIGRNTLIGERVSIRDGNHSVGISEIILKQPNIYKPVKIGEDVWIAAGCFVLNGSVVPEGVVIGANSVVTEKSSLTKHSIYAGSPVRFLKERD
jgi:acetyltransferase-like isoleucine patch superfamily enzyme